MSALEQRKQELLERRKKLQELLALQRECFQLEIQVMNRGAHSKDVTMAVELVSGYFAIDASELMSDRRTGEIAEARMWLYMVLFEHYRMSYSEIGRALKKHHGAPLHGIKAAKERIKRNPRDRETWDLICERLAIRQLADQVPASVVNRNGNGAYAQLNG